MTGNSGVSKMPLLKLMHILGYAGLLPFLIPVALLAGTYWFDYNPLLGPPWPPLASGLAAYLFMTYSAIILSFMSGTLWAAGQTINRQSAALSALLMSNLLALLAWFTVLLSVFLPQLMWVALMVLMLGYTILLWCERGHSGIKSEIKSQVKSVYWRMRLRLTALVIVLHLLMIILLEF